MRKMKPKIEEIQDLCTESSYERGVEYFHEGRVRDLVQSGQRITASVEGTRKYSVTIHTDKEDFGASCTCPYDWGGYCKHIVATLIALSEDYPKVRKDKEKKEKKVEGILNALSPEELKGFVRTEFEINKSLRDHFLIYFSERDSKRRTIKDYKKEIKLLYREVADRDGYVEYGIHVDFSYVRDLAERYLESGNAFGAAVIYRALSEVIAENMNNVDDSDGYYGEEFTRAIEDFVDCLNRVNLDYKNKKGYIDYFFDKYIENEPNYFRDHYSWALSKICHSKAELEHWRKLLESYLPEDLTKSASLYKHYMEKDFLSMQLHILDSLGENEAFYKLIEKYYSRDHDFCLLYIHHLEKDERNEKAVEIAEESLDIFPKHLTVKMRRFLIKYYEGHSPEKLKQNLIALFIQEGKWDDYERLKKLCPGQEWKKIFPDIIKGFSKEEFRHEDLIVNLFLREELFEDALERILQSGNLMTLKTFHKDLADKFPEMYFKAYKALIIPFADSRKGRAHYREIARYLKQMKRIKAFEKQFRELVGLLKAKYKNRPAFLDEISNV